MPNLDIPFQGQTLVKPGAYYADNVSAVASSNATPAPPLIYLGNGYGQKPQTAVTYGSSQALLAALRGGPASGYVPFLYSPSGQLSGAQQVTFVNVSENTQSALTLYSGTSGLINLTSTNYGLPSNLLSASVAASPVSGKTITLYDNYANTSLVGTNLGVPFALAYTGAATGVTYTVTTVSGSSTQLAITSPNAGESQTIPLSAGTFATVEAVVNFLNGTGYYSAYTFSNAALPSTSLDAASAVALSKPVSGVNQYVGVTATLGDPIFWVNQYAQLYATAALYTSGTVSSPASGLSTLAPTLFSGAANVPPALSDYASGFNLALTLNGSVIFADSNASGVVALGSQHSVTASSPAQGHWRRFFSGSSIGDSVTNAITAAQSCNAISATYVYPGIYRTSTTTGLNTLYGGVYAAAAAAGMAAGNQASLPLTNKALTGNGVEVALTVTQIDQLQQGGVMPIGLSSAGVPSIISDFTTWQNDANPENVFNQQVACRYYAAYTLQAALQPYVGTVSSPLNEVLVLRAAQTALNGLVYSQNNVNGVLASWNPATLQLVYTGATQTAAVSVQVQLVGQNRFITMLVGIQPLNFTTTISTQ
jgi:hypothetical protein